MNPVPEGQDPYYQSQDACIEREIEQDICQRFIRLSCEKMLSARHERGGAKLHRNLLILHLLRKARTESKMLPYECASLLKRSPMSTAVTRHLSAGAISPPQDNVFLSEAEVEHEEEEDDEETQETVIMQEVVIQQEDEEDVEVDVVGIDEEPPKEPEPQSTLRSVPSTYSLLEISKEKPKPNYIPVQVGGPLEYKVRDQDELEKQHNKRSAFRGNSLLIGQMMTDMTSRFEPLHLPFGSTNDAIEEGTDVASLLDESEQAKVPELSDDLDQQLQMISPPISPPEVPGQFHTDSGLQGGKFFVGHVVSPIFDDDEDDRPPQLFRCQESDTETDEDVDSGAEEDEGSDCDDEEADGATQKRRKRKTSTPRTTTVAEKRPCNGAASDSDSGVDVDAELGGNVTTSDKPKGPAKTNSLISVYSTGLGTTIVPQQPATSRTQFDQQVPVLSSMMKRIHSTPLFCK